MVASVGLGLSRLDGVQGNKLHPRPLARRRVLCFGGASMKGNRPEAGLDALLECLKNHYGFDPEAWWDEHRSQSCKLGDVNPARMAVYVRWAMVHRHGGIKQ